MLTQITHITLYVPNQDEALDFYVNKLGFQLHTDAMFGPMRWLTITLPKQKDLEISLMLAETAEEKALIGKQAGDKPLLAFACDDCIKTFEQLKNKGVTIVSEPKHEPWGTTMACSDPFGNMIYIVANG